MSCLSPIACCSRRSIDGDCSSSAETLLRCNCRTALSSERWRTCRAFAATRGASESSPAKWVGNTRLSRWFRTLAAVTCLRMRSTTQSLCASRCWSSSGGGGSCSTSSTSWRQWGKLCNSNRCATSAAATAGASLARPRHEIWHRSRRSRSFSRLEICRESSWIPSWQSAWPRHSSTTSRGRTRARRCCLCSCASTLSISTRRRKSASFTFRPSTTGVSLPPGKVKILLQSTLRWPEAHPPRRRSSC
mmetsp:Transcript_20993/g.58470  ORF Transcript_20993/g.58470 Transcript_20993/m.58470 type:complete len:247 (+) Transcript_20993:921-1661(+)